MGIVTQRSTIDDRIWRRGRRRPRRGRWDLELQQKLSVKIYKATKEKVKTTTIATTRRTCKAALEQTTLKVENKCNNDICSR